MNVLRKLASSALALCLLSGAFSPAPAFAAEESAAPRTMTSVLLEQAASFIGVPAPVQQGRPDEGQGSRQP
ncbi:MAG: hypothetical protein LBQ51_05150 [Desulfovibrio sp.]|jgi:hypothetical protein|nr:hypothetical protein [Desulfovibrio sp.]